MNQDINNGNNNNLNLEQNNTVVNTQNNETIICSNCGQPMLKTARCCIHCGQLNYSNDANASVKNVFEKAEKIKEKEERKNNNYNGNINTHSANSVFADSNGVSKKSKMFKTFKLLRNIIVILLIVAVIFNYKKIMDFFNRVRSNSYLEQVDKIVEKIDTKLVNNNCISNDAGDMYYSFYLSSDNFSTFVSLYTFNYFTGYVKVVPNGENYNYYVTITDGKYGFKNQLYSKEMDYRIVQEIGEIEQIPETTIVCSEDTE